MVVKRHVFDEIDFTFGLHFDSTLFSHHNRCELSSNEGKKKHQIQSVEIVQSVVKNLSHKIKEFSFFGNSTNLPFICWICWKVFPTIRTEPVYFCHFLNSIQTNPIHSMVFLLQTVFVYIGSNGCFIQLWCYYSGLSC